MVLTPSIVSNVRNLFMRYGVRSVTMDDISRELGISKKTLYKQISNKEDLIHTTVQSFVELEKDIVKKVVKEYSDALEQMLALEVKIEETLQNLKPAVLYDLQKYYNKSWLIIKDDYLKFIEATIKANLKVGMKQGCYRENINVDVLAKLYVSSSFAMIDDKHLFFEKYSKDKIFREFFYHHLFGVVSQSGRKKLVKKMAKNNRK